MSEALETFFPGIKRAWDDLRFKVCLTQHEKLCLCQLGGVSALYAGQRWPDIPPAAREKIIKGARAAIVMGRELSAAMLYGDESST